jgi:hypothetical protein
MVGAFLAAAVVTLVQFARVRDRRLLLLAALFALEGNALGREWFDPWREWSFAGVCLAGLALVFALSPRQPRVAKPAGSANGSAASEGSQTSGNA